MGPWSPLQGGVPREATATPKATSFETGAARRLLPFPADQGPEVGCNAPLVAAQRVDAHGLDAAPFLEHTDHVTLADFEEPGVTGDRCLTLIAS